MTASEIIQNYLNFYTERGHKQIPQASLVPENDPTTLFTSSGMQPLVPFLLGEEHPAGRRLVNVQNCFRGQDMDEIGDNRHTTFFRMLGNWSLGDYTKKEQLPWFFEFLTQVLKIPVTKLYVTVFEGYADIPEDIEAKMIWEGLFKNAGVDPINRIFYYGVDKNWWSRSGAPDMMPEGEPGGPDSEVFYDSGTQHDKKFGEECHVNCDCGRYIEIGNSVFMQYIKTANGFKLLPQQNVDFGGGLERLLTASENQQDVFQTSLLKPIISSIENVTNMRYSDHQASMRIITDHFIAACFISANRVFPSNKEQGYILRRLIRRGFDHLQNLESDNVVPIIETVVQGYSKTDPILKDMFETIKNIILEETQKYAKTQAEAKKFIQKKYKDQGDELMGVTEISSDDAFTLYTTHGLSPTQIRSLGYTFNENEFAQKMKEHQNLSRKGAEKKFKGGLADHEEKTIHGHTATHLLHKALRDKFGRQLHQTGSNITIERVRFDFTFDRKLTPEEIKDIEDTVNQKIKEDLPVYYKIIPLEQAREMGAIGLFGEKYEDTVKVYFIGGDEKKVDEYLRGGLPSGNQGKSSSSGQLKTPFHDVYSIEFCGGPHVEHTGVIKHFKITKEEGLGKGIRRVYSVVE